MIGRPFSILVPPDRIYEGQTVTERFQRGERFEHYETQRRRKDGRLIDVSISYSPIRKGDGTLIGTAVITRDISDRKRAERDAHFLAETSKSLAALIDYESTLQKIAQLAVPAFADWCTVDILDDANNLNRLAVAHVDPAQVRKAKQIHGRFAPEPDTPRGHWKIIRTGQPTLVRDLTKELLVEAASHDEYRQFLIELKLISYIGVPIKIRDKVLGVLTFLTAESGRRYEERDRIVAEELAARAAIAIENARLYREVKQADRRKEEFLSLLAHELRNPLAPISNGLQILKSTSGSNPTLGMMERQMQHLVRLVDDLLDISRVMRDKVELRRERIDLAHAVQRAIETSQHMIEAEGHELKLSLPSEPLWVDGDLVRLTQVVSNLVNNAARYSERNGRINITLERDSASAVLRVCDRGFGIARDKLPYIWDLFMQAHGSTQGGMGIGLTLVRSLVDQHGGSVEARSDGAGHGSEFIVRLPLAAAPVETPATSSPLESASPRRVLVVDDNVDAAESLALLLRVGGHSTQVAHDGPAALKLAENERPELAFLDIGMAGMDGYELAKRFRNHPGLKEVKLIALTGWGQEEDRRRSRQAGFDAHEVKPVSMESLKRILGETSPGGSFQPKHT
jgi:signal transduction histidine kinase/ActR/RegA family two-component response regulator